MNNVSLLFVIIGLYAIVYLWLYYLYSKKTRSFFNILTPAAFTVFPIFFLLEPIYILMNGLSGSISSYILIYSTQFSYNLFFVGALIHFYREPVLRNNAPENSYVSMRILVALLIISLCLYAPVLYEFSEYLQSPREIYTNTRSGYGLFFFFSITFIYLFYIASCYRNPKGKLFKISCFVIASLFLLMHGTKGGVIFLFFIYVLYNVYVLGHKVNLSKFIFFACFAFVAIISLFHFFSVGTDLDYLFERIISYSDYLRNTVTLLDKNYDSTYGFLMLEEEFWSRIPRAILQEKPNAYGSFYLSYLLDPKHFEVGQGYAAFAYGTLLFDFKYFGIFINIVWGCLIGYIANFCLMKLTSTRRLFYFILVLFFSNISLIPLGAGFLLPEHILLGYLAEKHLIRRKIR